MEISKMDGPSVEHSDSDSGESWTLLENVSVYADEAPEFIDEHVPHEAHHHEKDEDTDGTSIISDSDHDTPSPPPTDSSNFEKYNIEEGNLQTEQEIPDYTAVLPDLPNINSNNQDTVGGEDFLGDSHAKHKTYVHRRNKRLSTVLNIIVLGSVITAAGVAIGHMWGAKNDCTMQTTSSVNKILSNLYKLQEENAYLHNKIKELTSLNNNQAQQQQKKPSKYNKCRRVFEDSLNNNDPRKLTKCVDENYKNVDNLMEHLVRPKFEKEFVADIDKLKTVYLQNKSWLDDEISRRMKIEEELLKKYNKELNSDKEKTKDSGSSKNDDKHIKEDSTDNFVHFETPIANNLPKKTTYADSLQTEHIARIKRDGRQAKGESDEWVNSEHNINYIHPDIQDNIRQNVQSDQNHKSNFGHDDESFIIDFSESPQENTQKEQYTFSDDWTEVKLKNRRNEERYETDHDKSILELKQKPKLKVQKDNNYSTEEKPKFLNDKQYSPNNNRESEHAQDDKNKGKKEKRNSKVSSYYSKNDSDDNIIPDNFIIEDLVKDDRYVVNKLKQEKKRNGYINSSKKQKRKSKHEKWNAKGEIGERSVETPKQIVWNYQDIDNIKFDPVSITHNMGDLEGLSGSYKSDKDKSENIKKVDDTEQANWYEKRAVLRTEARKKYYEQFAETSPNNSSWYFRRMRKREQCRAKGNNSTFKKVYKEKKNHKIKK